MPDDGCLLVVPLKITSVMDSPRSVLAELSPMTQDRIDDIGFTAAIWPDNRTYCPGIGRLVGSTKDLKPANLMDFRRISLSGSKTGSRGTLTRPQHAKNTRCSVSASAEQHYVWVRILSINRDSSEFEPAPQIQRWQYRPAPRTNALSTGLPISRHLRLNRYGGEIRQQLPRHRRRISEHDL